MNSTPKPQQQKSKSESDLRSRITAAKTALRLKDLNVAAATAGHKLFQAHASKNPMMPANQILNKISPNARANYLKLTAAVPLDLLKDVPMSQYRNTLLKLKQARGSINSSFEIEGDIIEESISEAARLKDELNPPYMLVLKRRGIRIFPDGKRVALYVNDKMGLTFTIPYTPSGTSSREILPGVQAEEIEHFEENIEHIKSMSRKGGNKELKFLDGSSLQVGADTAKAIHLVHDALNDENKAKVAKMLSHSKGQFMKVADFAHKNVAYRIGNHSK